MSDKAVSAAVLANAIRVLSVDAIERATEGHPGAPLGMAEIATALFTRHMKFNPQDPLWPDRDRFVMSNGHGSMLVYSILHLTGYAAMSMDQIKSFRRLGSHCAGHPERDLQHGIEVTTGLLGQGIANAVGMAVAEAFLRNQFGAEIFDHHTFAFVGDGCLQEGVGQEVISLAGHLRLGKLIFLFDDNEMTDDGATRFSISEDVPARFRNAHWHVQEVDGHDIDAVDAAIRLAKKDPRPSFIACKTSIGKGIPRLEGQRGAHGGRIFAEDCAAVRERLQWPHPPFEIPSTVYQGWRVLQPQNAAHHEAWHKRVKALPAAQKAELERVLSGALPASLHAALEDFKTAQMAEDAAPLSIFTSSAIADLVCAHLPNMLTGAPDLEGPTRHKNGLAAFDATHHGGRYLHYGVREHAMGSMLNGMAAHGGVVPCGATYLVFSDYERPALRMAAMMRLPVIQVFSHDSIGVGTNGPTHQPVEFLASFRAIPHLWTLRPADTIEAVECWQVALARKDGPSCLIFPRQTVSRVRQTAKGENLAAKGGYVLSPAKGKRLVTLFATGSEVALALQAQALLEAKGHGTAVISMPCFELFEMQDKAYRDAIIGRGTVRIAIEAGIQQGWERYLGEDGAFIGMTDFGLSAPADDLYRHFGITAEAVVAAALQRL